MNASQRLSDRNSVIEQEVYWLEQLGNILPVLEIPFKRSRVSVQSFIRTKKTIKLDEKLGLELNKFCQSENIPLFIALLATLKIILLRYTEQEDIIVGSLGVDSCREGKGESQETFTNPIALRTSLAGELTAKELLRRVATTVEEAVQNRDYPFEKLVENLGRSEDLTRAPIFQVIFLLCNVPFCISETPIQEEHLADIEEHIAKCDLVIWAAESEGNLTVSCSYNPELYESDSILRMLGHFQTMLAGLVANPEQNISTLPLLTEAERHQFLVEWNNTDAEYPRNKCSHQLVEEQVERTPDAVAVEFEEEQLTYRELNRRANQVAHYLRSLGVKPEVPVGFCVDRSEARVIGLLGIFKSNGVYVPLDPTYPEERLAYMLSDSSVQVLLTTQKTLLSLPELALCAQGRQIVYLDRDWEVISQQNSENPVTQVKPDNLAYVTYTSGSTGRPKGVAIEHRAFCHYIWWQVHSTTVSSSGRTLQFTPLSFDISLQESFTTWSSGGRLVLVSEEVRRNPMALASFVALKSIERLFLPYVALRNLAEVVNNGGSIPTTLREIMVAGEQLQITPAIAYLFKQTGGILYNQYGLSENPIIAQFTLSGETSIWPTLPPVGSAVTNGKVYILDRCLQPVPIGVRGELYVGGEWLARGYLNLPELTSERFISNPFGSGRLLRTRDIARYLPDGNIEYLGRADNWVKIRGFSIELGEIETVMAQHPAVKESVVVPREDIPGNKRLVAYVVPHEHTASILNLEAEQERVSLKEQLAKKLELAVRNYLRERLPDYMVPAIFVAIEKMPLTPSGKVNRLALPAPGKSRPELATTLVTPKSETEKLIAQVLIEVLELDVVGIHDNFFELGGHSLLLTQIHYKLAEMFGMELSTMALMQYPTIHTLAQHLNQTDFKQSAVNVGEQNNRLTLKSIAEQQRQHRQGNLPLSFAQQQMWLLSQLEPNNPFYSELEALRLKGFLNVVALEQSINKIIQRHEALRTNFVTVDEQPVQVIAQSLTLKMSVVDLTALPSSEKENSTQRLATAQAQQPFDLTTDPLIQATLLKITDTEHILLLKIHHIVWDGWSMGVFFRELAAFYTSFCKDLSSALPSLPIQYADFAVWQRQWLTPEVLESQLAYWKQQLSDAPALLELPTDRVRPSIQTYRGAHQRAALSKELTLALMSLSQKQGVTLFMTLLAAFQTLLSRYTGQTDICVGTAHANRSRPEIDELIGFFVNTLVLRTCFSENPSFEDVLSRVRDVALGAYAHQDLPFEKLVEQLQPERSLSYTPLVQVMLVLNEPMLQIQMAGLTVSPLAVETTTAKFDLTLSLENTDSGLIGNWEYNTDLFDASTIARMAKHFQTLLEGIVANPQQKVSQLPLLTEQERHQLLVEWNNTQTEYPNDKCIHQLFEEQVERTPDAIAVVFEDKQLTYRELNAKANKIAHYLQTLGVEPEVLVGICVERSLEMMVGLLGILKAGGAYVPLDPQLPHERLSFILSDSSVPVLLTKSKLMVRLPENKARVVCLDTDWGIISHSGEENPVSSVGPQNLAYIIYTSGSTGQPKGTLIIHQGLVNYLSWCTEAYAVADGSGSPVHSSIGFDATITSLFSPLLVGKKVVLLPEDQEIEALGAILCSQSQFSLVKITPAHLDLLSFLIPNWSANNQTRAFIIGGEALSGKTVSFWRESAPSTKLINEYGPTETVVGCCVYEVDAQTQLSGGIPIGRPIANTQLYILDPYLQPVPIGVLGELYIGGAGVARGYLNRPDLTESKFIPNRFSDEPGSRLYKTGDKARYLPDGNIEFKGRLDNQVKIRGFRIELGEIEAALRQYPGVQETVVVAREDVPDRKYLAAYIVPNRESAIASSVLRSFLQEKLPDYMIPGAFVMLDALPLTPNGKVDRKALPTPDTARQELQTDLIAPRTISEEILAQIWREVFHRDIQSIHDNFFELGGDSILSIQIISKANSAGLHLTVKQIFQHQTIAELAAVAKPTGTLKAFQGLVTGSLPLTPIQHWFFAKNLPEAHHYNQAFLLLVPPNLNPDLLQQALQQLLRHHDALRLRFNQTEAGWQQFNALPDEIVPFSLIDLSTLQEEALSQTIESTSSQLQASLNLNSGPLLRVALFHLGTQKPSRLLLVIHHLAVDGVSWRILLEDLQTVYQQLSSSKPIQLPPKTTSFKHWAEKLTEYAFSSAAKKELTYWSNISTSKITQLPVDSKGGANTKASARSVKVSLNSEETRALLQEIHKAYHTQINDILLTALVQVLATWNGSNSVLIDLEGHGREEILPDVDLSRTVGWFTTIFPVHLELKATENLGDAIESIKEQLRAIPNRGIGYGVLRYLSGDAEITSQLSSLPEAPVSFNYLGQFDWGMQSDSFIKLASESFGSEHSQLGHRSHLLEINGLVVENQLQLEWTYSENFHSSGTIESLAQDFVVSLQTLIAHCLSADAGDYTPDVSENQTLHSLGQPINNDQHLENNLTLPLHLLELPLDISELLPGDTESAYPLAKMQEFMLHHYVNDTQKMGVYHCQQSHDIYDESLDLNAFKKALLILVQKHPALRTVFITSNGKPTVQVVKKKLRFFINEQDISHIKSEEQSNYIDAVMKQDRQNLFEVENPNEPLFRFRIFQKAENKFEFLMSIHHAITDGWGNLKFLNELYEIYLALKKGEELTVVPAANVYKEFVALEKEILDSQDAADFWKIHLKDHTYKPLKPLTTSVEKVEVVAEEYNFEEEIIVDVRQLCRNLGVSPKALFLSTYLDLIGTVMKSNRVCVGVVSNGRTERLSDPFGALGLFWNIVPFGQPTQEDKGVQIKNVQQSLIDIEPYVRYPLMEILSDQQKSELFFATFNFVNFHNAKNLKADTGLKVNWRRSHDKFNFPLNYTVSMSPVEGNVSLSVKYDQTYFSCQEIRSMLHNYIEMVRSCWQTC
ncbi:amino acid adenylation domain-containing protein [Microcoleus sp. F10-C6]|uniref:amino acid adenylation domain-containing protein n=1 Tax=unclassified Microcoleus TaxID=2642155 RepID=UPI002FD39AC8